VSYLRHPPPAVFRPAPRARLDTGRIVVVGRNIECPAL
jgi:hypothetical protein